MRLPTAILVTAFAIPSLTAAIAHADQCAINDQAIATKAVALAKQSKRALALCEPCGDKSPGFPFDITTVETRAGQVYLNGRSVDLAYTFIHVTGDEYTNLGLAAGCTAERVSRSVVDTKPVHNPPPKPPMPRGPRPAPMPRVASPDELAGTWSVSMRAGVSTCGPLAASVTASWSITVTGGDIVVTTADKEEFFGTQPALEHGMYRPQLQPRAYPSGAVVQLTQSLKDRFWGKLVRIESTGQRRDPSCITVLDLSGVRAP